MSARHGYLIEPRWLTNQTRRAQPMPFAEWVIFGPQGMWKLLALWSAAFQPCRTLIRGLPWEDTQ